MPLLREPKARGIAARRCLRKASRVNFRPEENELQLKAVRLGESAPYDENWKPLGAPESVIKVREQVIEIFDPHADAQESFDDARRRAYLLRHVHTAYAGRVRD
jgi:hypothetical protein